MDIRTYCLSVPGTYRRKVVKAQLDSLGFPYEFVTGHVLKDGPVAACLTMRHFSYYPYTYKLEATINSLACRQGMLAMLHKIYQDGGEWSLAIQDDVALDVDWPTSAQEFIKTAPPEIGMIAVYDRGACYADAVEALPSGFKVVPDAVGCTEPARLLRRDYVKRNIEALENTNCESDWSIQFFTGSDVWWAVAPYPLARQRMINSSILAGYLTVGAFSAR